MGNDTVRVVIAAGGTGGHLYPGIALAEEFQRRGKTEVMFIGTSYGIESQVLKKMPYQFKKIWIRGLHRRMSLSNLLLPVQIPVSLIQCAVLFAAFRPQVVIGTGGYVSGPALVTALLMGIPTVIQEQNSYPGLVNRVLSRWVSQVHATYEASRPYFKTQKLYLSGNPVRIRLKDSDKENGYIRFGLDRTKKTLFIFGGSQGAQSINQVVMHSLDRMMSLENLQVLWGTGRTEYEHARQACERFHGRISVQEYIDDMSAAYAISDFVLCRAGATTLAEITVYGLPAILVPFPFATAGHQEFNARAIQEAGAGIMLAQSDLNEETLLGAVNLLLTDRDRSKRMSEAAKSLARPAAAADIVTAVLRLIET